jgi:small subunit ribosomal protein S20
MPHTRSARKNLRKTEKRRLRNRTTKKAIKTQIKRFQAALDNAEAKPEDRQKEYDLAAKKLDKAAARRIIHPNLAARKKSQLATALHRKKTEPKPEAKPQA